MSNQIFEVSQTETEAVEQTHNTETQIQSDKNTQPAKRNVDLKIKIGAILLVLTLCGCVAVIIYLLHDRHSIKRYNSIQDASDDQNEMFVDMMLDFEHHDGKVSNETYLRIKTAMKEVFNTYDEDNDGYLSFDEYKEYTTLSGNLKIQFDAMDWDGDGIISFRDMVTHLTLLHKSPIDDAYLIDDLKIDVKEMYNYSYVEGDSVWYEYAADSLFEYYDNENNGYILFDAYVTESASVEYAIMFDQSDSDGISFDVFFESHFNSQLFSYIIHNTIYGDQDMLNAGRDYYSNIDSSLRVELTLCPTLIQPINKNRRRLNNCCANHIINSCRIKAGAGITGCLTTVFLTGNPICLIGFGITSVGCVFKGILAYCMWYC